MLLIHTFSVLSLQLKKLRRHNQSAIDLSNANGARGHKEVRRPTGLIVVTNRYSNQQGSNSRQNYCQVQPTENIGNLSASRRCLRVRTTVSTVWSAAHPSVTQNVFLTIGRVTRRQPMRHFTSHGTDQYQNSSSNLLSRVTSIDLDCCCPPTASVLRIKPHKLHSN